MKSFTLSEWCTRICCGSLLLAIIVFASVYIPVKIEQKHHESYVNCTITSIQNTTCYGETSDFPCLNVGVHYYMCGKYANFTYGDDTDGIDYFNGSTIILYKVGDNITCMVDMHECKIVSPGISGHYLLIYIYVALGILIPLFLCTVIPLIIRTIASSKKRLYSNYQGIPDSVL